MYTKIFFLFAYYFNYFQQKDNNSLVCGKTSEDEELLDMPKSRSFSPEMAVQERKSPSYLRPSFDFEPEIIHKANVSR